MISFKIDRLIAENEFYYVNVKVNDTINKQFCCYPTKEVIIRKLTGKKSGLKLKNIDKISVQVLRSFKKINK